MKYLLDTHALLWWITEPEKLSSEAQQIIKSKSNLVYVSSVSIWEMAIKKSIGKLTLPHNLLETITTEQFKFLPILPEEALGVADLPLIHADPFDRLLVMQAKWHDLVLITNDAKICEYPVIVVRA
jgi:PIN domain nuclease of toxin-antitoxin system